MKKSRFTDSQIIEALKRVEAGLAVPELCREMGVSTATFYKWRSKFGGMDASLMARMKELEEENRRLRKMYVEEKLKAEFANVKRTYLPMHTVIRIDEVSKEGPARIERSPPATSRRGVRSTPEQTPAGRRRGGGPDQRDSGPAVRRGPGHVHRRAVGNGDTQVGCARATAHRHRHEHGGKQRAPPRLRHGCVR